MARARAKRVNSIRLNEFEPPFCNRRVYTTQSGMWHTSPRACPEIMTKRTAAAGSHVDTFRRAVYYSEPDGAAAGLNHIYRVARYLPRTAADERARAY